MSHGRKMRYPIIILVVLACSVLLSACKTDNFSMKDNPLGYNHLWGLKDNKGQPAPLPNEREQAKLPRLRPVGLGAVPSTWHKQYSNILPYSQSLTEYAFQASLERFPDGDTVIIDLGKGQINEQARVTQISFVAGNRHPTTLAQAQAIGQGFLPLDVSTPTVVQTFNMHSNENITPTCQAISYVSPTLAQIFPAQDFVDGKGQLAKAGSVTISFFPLYYRDENGEKMSYYSSSYDYNPKDENQISSILITLGTRTYC